MGTVEQKIKRAAREAKTATRKTFHAYMEGVASAEDLFDSVQAYEDAAAKVVKLEELISDLED